MLYINSRKIRLVLTSDEYLTLGWLADRYVYASEIFDYMKQGKTWKNKNGRFETEYFIKEDNLYNSYDDCIDPGHSDNYIPSFPCMGGNLKLKIKSLYDVYLDTCLDDMLRSECYNSWLSSSDRMLESDYVPPEEMTFQDEFNNQHSWLEYGSGYPCNLRDKIRAEIEENEDFHVKNGTIDHVIGY